MISGVSTVVAARNLASRDLDGERVILQLDGGRYFGLNAVAARVWSEIQEPRTVNAIRDMLVQEYDVAPAQCEKDLQALLKDLTQKGLIEIRP
jgi:hypothetical protein